MAESNFTLKSVYWVLNLKKKKKLPYFLDRSVSQTQGILIDTMSAELASDSVLREIKFKAKRWFSGFNSRCLLGDAK